MIRISLALILGFLGPAFSTVGQPDDEPRFLTARNQCGAHCVFHACKAVGVEVSFAEVNRVLPSDDTPKSLLELRNALDKLGVDSYGWRFPGRNFPSPSPTMVIPLRFGKGNSAMLHYVLVLGTSKGRILVVDGASNPVWVQLDSLIDHWTGDALVIGKLGTVDQALRSATVLCFFTLLVATTGVLAARTCLLSWQRRRSSYEHTGQDSGQFSLSR